MSENNQLEIIVETKDLVHALTFASSVVEKRNVIAELGNIKLSVKDGLLEIVATDMDLTLSQTIGAQIISAGQTTASATILTDIARKIPDKEIKLKQVAGSDQLEVIGKNCSFNLLTLPAEKFPALEEVSGESILKISCRDLAKLIEYTQFSMSTEETRYNLNGIYLHKKDNEFCAAATDGHRLSVAAVDIISDSAEAAQTEKFGVILPRKTVAEIQKVIKDPKNIQLDIEIALSVNKIKFACGKIVMVSKLIDGTFPEYDNFIPATSLYTLQINTKLLASAIERVAIVTVEKLRAIKMLFKDDQLEITASGEARGNAKEIIAYSKEGTNLCDFSGEGEIEIGFNPKYLTDVLGTIKFEHIEFGFNNPASPALIKIPEHPKDSFVIMPVKV